MYHIFTSLNGEDFDIAHKDLPEDQALSTASLLFVNYNSVYVVFCHEFKDDANIWEEGEVILALENPKLRIHSVFKRDDVWHVIAHKANELVWNKKRIVPDDWALKAIHAYGRREKNWHTEIKQSDYYERVLLENIK